MGAARQFTRDIAKLCGIYEWIKIQKDRIYRSVRDCEVALTLGLRHVFSRWLDWELVRRALEEFKSQQLLDRIEQATKAEGKNGTPFIPATSSAFNLTALYILCRVLKPGVVVETGVASGASSLVMLTALERNGVGRLHSIDLPASQWKETKASYGAVDPVSLPLGRSTGWLVPADLRSRWELILGDSQAELPKLASRLKSIDLFYHDAEHTFEAMIGEYRAVWPHLPKGAVLTSDDVGWNRAFQRFVEEKGDEGTGLRWFSFGAIRKG